MSMIIDNNNVFTRAYHPASTVAVRQHIAECASYWRKYGNDRYFHDEERDDQNYKVYDC